MISRCLFYVILLLILLINPCFAKDKTEKSPQISTRTNAQNYKDMVFAMCIANAYLNEPSVASDIGSSISALRDFVYYDMENSTDAIKSLIDNYLSRDYFNPLAESEIKGIKFNMLKCLDLYHSKELEKQVKRFVINPNHTYMQDNRAMK